MEWAIKHVDKSPRHKEIFDILMDNIEKKELKLERVKPYYDSWTVFTSVFQYNKEYAADKLIRFVAKHPKYHRLVPSNFFATACNMGNDMNKKGMAPKFEFIEFIIKNAKKLGIDINKRLNLLVEKSGFGLLLAKQYEYYENRPNLKIIEFILKNAEKYHIDLNITSEKDLDPLGPLVVPRSAPPTWLTPFLIACTNCSDNQNEVIKLFIKYRHKVDLFIEDDKRKNGLQLALEQFHVKPEVIETLFELFKRKDKPCPDREFENLKSKLDPVFIFGHFCGLIPGDFYYHGNLYDKMLSLARNPEDREDVLRYRVEEENRDITMKVAFKAKNRDAVMAILAQLSHLPEELCDEYITKVFRSKQRFDAMMILITCTPANCCKDYNRLKFIKDILTNPMINFPLTEEIVASVPCEIMKTMLNTLVFRNKLRSGVKRKFEEVEEDEWNPHFDSYSDRKPITSKVEESSDESESSDETENSDETESSEDEENSNNEGNLEMNQV